MSRIGIKPIELLEGVNLEIAPTELSATGPLGSLKVALPEGIKVSLKDKTVTVSRLNDQNNLPALHGTVRALLSNAITGVKSGFVKKLELVGIGYRAAIEGNALVLQVGFTHPVKLEIPENLKVTVEKNTISISGFDKHHVGQFAAVVRAVKKPEPYKGKGIRYAGEVVRMKQGKATKAGG